MISCCHMHVKCRLSFHTFTVRYPRYSQLLEFIGLKGTYMGDGSVLVTDSHFILCLNLLLFFTTNPPNLDICHHHQSILFVVLVDFSSPFSPYVRPLTFFSSAVIVIYCFLLLIQNQRKHWR